jgi:phage portal protein BeeE
VGLRTWLKQSTQMFFPRMAGSWFVGLPRTTYDYERDVGTGARSSVVMGVVQWMMRSFPEAPMVVQTREDDDVEIVSEHPLTRLIARPNDFYSGEQLWMATVWSWCLFGNSYWRVVYERSGRPRELWWVPPWLMEPLAPRDGSRFLTGYRYTPDGKAIDLALNQVNR